MNRGKPTDLKSMLTGALSQISEGHVTPAFEHVAGCDRNRIIDKELKVIHQLRMTGAFSLTPAQGSVTASFKDGQLHCEDGPAWFESWGYDRMKSVWALQGNILAGDDDDYKYLALRNGENRKVDQIDLIALGINRRPVGAVQAATRRLPKPLVDSVISS